jgi:hypothetical protein
VKHQESVRRVSIESILRTVAFAAGVDDVRNGRPPNYDSYHGNDHWSYERGRQWASLAPVSMPLKVDGKLNPKAVALANAAYERRLIV